MYCSDVVCLLIFLCAATCQDQTQLPEGSRCLFLNTTGTCVNLYKCTSAAIYYDRTNNGLGRHVSRLSKPQVCSYRQDGEPVVCCTDCERDETEHYRTKTVLWSAIEYDKPQNSKAFDKCMEFMRELLYRCIETRQQTIYLNYDKERQCHIMFSVSAVLGNGGYFAGKWQFPHMALLGYGRDRESAQWLCGGAIISEYFILTAAHCSSTATREPVSFAALGVLTRSEVSNFWKVYKIQSIIVHPQYEAPSKYHDIALLRTTNEINFGKGILPACLDVGILETWYASAPGWGRLGHKADLADNLMVMNLHKYNESLCSSMFPPHGLLKRGYDTDTQLCFGRQDMIVDTCQGDSGGPLHADLAECTYFVFGVTSFGKYCGIRGNAGIYTRVRHYVPWIESIVWPDS